MPNIATPTNLRYSKSYVKILGAPHHIRRLGADAPRRKHICPFARGGALDIEPTWLGLRYGCTLPARSYGGAYTQKAPTHIYIYIYIYIYICVCGPPKKTRRKENTDTPMRCDIRLVARRLCRVSACCATLSHDAQSL